MLHLSNFPEDYVIERERLARRWIAEGLIREERGLGWQEVAEKYFYELLNKSMIEPFDIGYDGKVHGCRVHDMMLELILSKSTEDNFITVVNSSQTVWESSQCKIRHLSIQNIDQKLASELAKKDLSHVRSLTVTSSSCIKYLPSLAEFPLLRVLDFEGCTALKCLNEDERAIKRRRIIRESGSHFFKEYDMSGMKDLSYLKYLSFRKTGMSELPSGVMMLRDLVTLDLRETYISELPAGIVRLIKLQHLLIKCKFGVSKVRVPTGIGNMTNLREILGLNITMSSVGAVEELGNLINLNVLHVVFMDDRRPEIYKRHAEMLLSSLCKLGRYQLQSIHIDGSCLSPFELLDSWSPAPSCLQSFEMSTQYGLSKLPKWIISELSNLLELCIHLNEVTEDAVHIFGGLPAVRKLDLETTSFQNGRLTVKRGGFQCLNQFVFLVAEAVSESLLFEKGAMPNLEGLSLTLWLVDLASTAEAYGFYLGIEHLPCLKVAYLNFFMSQPWHMDHNVKSSIYKSTAAAIKMEGNLHPNHPRVTFNGREEYCDPDDEVKEEQRDIDDEENEEQNDADDEVNEEQNDADEYWDAISSSVHEGNVSS